MKRNLLLTLLSAVFSISALWGQATARRAFETVPQEVVLLLTPSTRFDMIDYYESGVAKPSLNLLEGESLITFMDNRKITFTQGESTETTFAILPRGKGEIIMVINNIKIPETDSQIKFYTTSWEPITTDKIIKLPTLSEWTGNPKGEQRVDVENALPFMTAEADFDTETNVLTLTPTILPMLDKEAQNIISPLLPQSIKYRWNGKQFKK